MMPTLAASQPKMSGAPSLPSAAADFCGKGGKPTPVAVAIATAFLALACLPAQPQAAPSPTAPGAPPVSSLYRIAGTVINAVTGEAVPRATVTAQTGDDFHAVASVVADGEGHFALEGLPAAKYPLTASRRGFRSAYYDEHEGYNTAIATGPDQDTGRLAFRLVPGSILRGAVTADGGDPVEGASVMLFLKPRGHNPGDRIKEAGTTTTDDTGAYEFGNLAEGEYLLAVKAEPWYAMHPSGSESRSRPSSGSTVALDVAYPLTFFDSATDEAAASTIVLAKGNREVANINLHAVPALHLVVQAPEGQGPSHVGTELRQTIFGSTVSVESVYFPEAVAGRTFEPTVAPGHYELTQGDPPRIVDLDLASSQRIDPNAGTQTVSVSGTFLTSSGSILPGNAAVSLDSLDPARRQAPIEATFSKGIFKFDSVLPGVWELSAEGSSGQLPIASITVGSRTRAGNQLTVKDRPLSIVATVSVGETRIDGFASKNGKGAPGVMVVLVPKNISALPSLARRDQSDSDGSFSLRDVVPGLYTVVAIEDGWELDWERPEVIRRYLPGRIAVTTEGSGKLVNLDRPVPVQAR
jgi:hypothetical protein